MAAAPEIDIPSLLDQQKVGRFHILVVVLCALGTIMDGLDVQIIGYVAPSLAKAWQLPPGALGPVFGAGLFGMVFGATCFGILGDRFGRKNVIIACATFFGCCTLLTSTADSLTSLFLWRFATGLGLGGIMPNEYALINEYSPKRIRATLMMLVGGCFPLGGALGGLLSARLVPSMGWAAAFIVCGIITLALVPLLIFALPESIRRLALKGGEDERIRRLLMRINSRLVFDASARFVIREDKPSGFPVGQLFRERRTLTTLCLWTMLFMNMLAMFLLTNWLPTVINNAGFSVEKAVMATSLLQFGGVVGTILVPILSDRFRPASVLTVVFVAEAIFIAGISGSGSIFFAIVAFAFSTGFCLNGGQLGCNILASMSYPTAIRSTGVGWALGIGRLGAVAGPVIGGLLLSLSWPTQSIFLACAVAPLIGAFAAFTMRREPGKPPVDRAAGPAVFTPAE